MSLKFRELPGKCTLNSGNFEELYLLMFFELLHNFFVENSLIMPLLPTSVKM